MSELVYNALGATQNRPCPTEASRWFSHGHCSREDVQMWRAAAANLYQLGLLPLLSQLERVDASLAAEFQPQVVLYRSQFQGLPSGSLLSTSKNLEQVTEAVALMHGGNLLVERIQEAMRSRGVQPIEVGLPPPPDQVLEKSPWVRYVWPTAIVGSVVAVLGLTMLATRQQQSQAEDPRDDPQ